MSDYEKYFGKVLHFLSFRPRSEKEIKDFLIKKKTSEEVSEKILKFLLEQRLVNDEEFVRWWIQQRNRFSPKGERLVRLELRQKGIAQDVIDAIFEEKKSQDDGAEEGKSQEELAKEIAEKKMARYNGLPKDEIYQKLGAVLARRGFDWETIRNAIDEQLHKK